MFQKLVLSAAVAGFVACTAPGASAQTTRPNAGAKGQAYECEFVFDSTPYTGTMTLQIARKGGIVAGRMVLDRPTPVDGDVAGTLKGEALSLDYTYTMAQQNCTGRVVVTATMTPKRDAATGTATATGCSDGPIEGTFTLKKAVAGASGTK